MGHPRFYILLCVVAVTCSACTYKGAIRDDFYLPAARQDQKIPRKVVVDWDKSIQVLHMTPVIYADIDLNPGLANAVKAELATVFEEVIWADDIRRSKESDLLAYVSANIVQRGFGRSYACQVNVALSDARSKNLISNFGSAAPIEIGTPGGVYASMLLTVASLGMAFPGLFEFAADSYGTRAIELLEARLPEIVRTIVADIRSKRKLVSFSQTAPYNNEQAPQLFASPGLLRDDGERLVER
jgi:hypothetical protein